jgi:hypothetical protein
MQMAVQNHITSGLFCDRKLVEIVDFNKVECQIRSRTALLVFKKKQRSRVQKVDGILVVLRADVSGFAKQRVDVGGKVSVCDSKASTPRTPSRAPPLDRVVSMNTLVQKKFLPSSSHHLRPASSRCRPESGWSYRLATVRYI